MRTPEIRTAARHAFAALSVIALAVTLFVNVPGAEAKKSKKDPVTAAREKAEKRASKVAKKIVRAGVRRIRAQNRSTIRHIRRLTKAVKTGKDAAELSGVPGKTEGRGAISDAQLDGLLLNFVRSVQDDANGTLALTFETFSQVRTAPEIAVVLSDPCSTLGSLGGGGVPDDAVIVVSTALDDSARDVASVSTEFQTAFADCGRTFNFQLTPPVSVNPTTLLDASASLLVVPSVAGTIATDRGQLFVISATPDAAPASGLQYEFRVARDDGSVLFSDRPAPRLDLLTFDVPPVAATGTILVQRGVSDDSGFVSLGATPLQFPSVATGTSPVSIDPLLQPAAGLLTSLLPQGQIDGVLAKLAAAESTPVDVFICNSNPNIAKVIPQGQTRIAFAVPIGSIPDSPEIRRVLDGSTAFPAGPGPNAFTVFPQLPTTTTTPGWHVIITAAQSTIALSASNRYYQYGFVFDTDANTSNNYVPVMPFTEDYYGNTDRWYSIEYDPSTGWVIKVIDARNDNFLTVPSMARALIKDNCLVLFVPSAEFVVQCPQLRQTAFGHDGDFGQTGLPWNGHLIPSDNVSLRPLCE